ncbi:MAG: lysine-2,3-aminomutase-like protein [Rhodoblastus sp.]|nr:MAG: lysine-2,3-aminomutase-like protein [Rhodoblastus sp.]
MNARLTSRFHALSHFWPNFAQTVTDGNFRTLRDPAALAEAGLIAPEAAAALAPVAARYAVAVTPALAALIDPADPTDPIAAQFLPDPAELLAAPGELADPIGDAARAPLRGIVHRYPDRVLLTPTYVCPVYCRFCFRREVVGPGAGAALTREELEAALDYVRARPAIREVIVTGGDPLAMPAKRIAALSAALAGIAHVGTARWHSRVPVATPQRVTQAFAQALASREGLSSVVAVHVNHPRELTREARAALRRLQQAGVMLVSQTVLLKGVNADAATLTALMRGLVEAGVKPYYLHHPDLAPGTARFRLTIDEGLALYRRLRGAVSGLMVPTYVLDIPGGFGKVALDSDAARRQADGGWTLTDFSGAAHFYRDA